MGNKYTKLVSEGAATNTKGRRQSYSKENNCHKKSGHSSFMNIFQYLAKSYPAKHQSCHCPLGNVQFGPFPNLGDPYPSTLRSRLSWRRVWNFVHGRHNDGGVWHDDHDVVVEGKQVLWYDVNCGNLLTALSKQHLPVTFFCTFASAALISFRLYHVKE